jgi:hypothetical protein
MNLLRTCIGVLAALLLAGCAACAATYLAFSATGEITLAPVAATVSP